MNKERTTAITQAAVIAALYVVLTLIVNAIGLASGAIQIRISEALTILPYFIKSAIPGLCIGCVVANIVTGAALPDIIFGSIATLIGAIGTYMLRKNKWLAPVPPILSNTIIVPIVLYYAYGVKPIWFSVVTVGIGEVICCGIMGMLLLFELNKRKASIFKP